MLEFGCHMTYSITPYYDTYIVKTTYYSKKKHLQDPFIIQAVRDNKKELVLLLLRGGADVNIKNQTGYTALIYACLYKYTDIIKILLERGADVNIQCDSKITALDTVCFIKNIEIIKMLLDFYNEKNIEMSFTSIEENKYKDVYNFCKNSCYMPLNVKYEIVKSICGEDEIYKKFMILCLEG